MDELFGGESLETTCFDATRICEVNTWLASQFDAVGKDVPDFEYTPRSIAELRKIATLSHAKTLAATILVNDFLEKAAEYRSQAARLREILENVGLLAQENIPPSVISSSRVLANIANLLDIRDIELSSFLVAVADLSLRKTTVEERKAKFQQESKVLLDFTRKAIARLTYLKR
ncbi:AUGMIN subunit 1-like [Lycium ferocissimum]|uniref:AUGMIN subunit 1-like n=1 Tax=Lycium ferocissimum TaxID=112874 RepID=UPI002814DC2A|nr:AUGMIN subunit 1-like [Lycium ferocissimum]